MRKFALLLLFITLSAHAQEITQKQAEEAFKNAKSVGELVFTEIDTLYADLGKGKKGDIVEVGGEIYRIVDHISVVTQRYGSLYLNEETYSQEEIIKAKGDAVAEYNKGVRFETIVKQYYPDDAKELVNIEAPTYLLSPDFLVALDTRNPGDIFTTEDNGRTYIIVKNGESLERKAVRVLILIY